MMPDDATVPPLLRDPLLPRIPPPLLARDGEVVAATSVRLQAVLGELPAPVAAELRALERLGLQLQTVVRGLAGRGRLEAEPVDLCAALQQAQAQWQPRLQPTGTTLHVDTKPLSARVNAAALAELIDLAIEHAASLGPRLTAHAVLDGLPARPTLRLVVQRTARDGFELRPDEVQELHWTLLSLLAQASGVTARRQLRDAVVELDLSFALPAVAGVEGLAARDMIAPVTMPHGSRVLLVEPDDATRVQAQRLLFGAGVQVEAVATLDAARRAWARRLPDALVTGIALADPACAAAVDELRALQPSLHVVELADDPDAFALSLPAAGAPARVGRRQLERALVAALGQELATPA